MSESVTQTETRTDPTGRELYPWEVNPEDQVHRNQDPQAQSAPAQATAGSQEAKEAAAEPAGPRDSE